MRNVSSKRALVAASALSLVVGAGERDRGLEELCHQQ